MKTLKSVFAVSLVATAVLAQTSAPSGTDRTTGSGGDRGALAATSQSGASDKK